MKRSSQKEAENHLPEPKRLKEDDEKYIHELKSIQDKILQVDDACAKEQLKVQRQFAAQLKPLYEERQKVLRNVKNFWSSVIQSAMGAFELQLSLTAVEKEIMEQLEDVIVEDSLDDFGSYQITFQFNTEGIKKYFSPSVLVKKVNYTFEFGGDATADSTPIQWAGGKDLVAEASQKKKLLESSNAESTEDLSAIGYSFFEWFTNVYGFDTPQLGDHFRREVWPNVMPFLLDDADDEDSAEDYEAGDHDENEDYYDEHESPDYMVYGPRSD